MNKPFWPNNLIFRVLNLHWQRVIFHGDDVFKGTNYLISLKQQPCLHSTVSSLSHVIWLWNHWLAYLWRKFKRTMVSISIDQRPDFIIFILEIYLLCKMLLKNSIYFPVVKCLSYSCYVWILLCRCYLYMHCCADAEHCAREALQIISKEDLHENLENFVLALLVKSLSLQAEEDKLKDAISECLKVRISVPLLDLLDNVIYLLSMCLYYCHN